MVLLSLGGQPAPRPPIGVGRHAWATCQIGDMSPVQIRPVGGAAGCLTMIAVSIVLSILLTVVLNLIVR